MRKLCLLFAVLYLLCVPVQAYSVLTHQAVIDSAWQKSLKPLLQQHYPKADSAQLAEAYSYAYGGAIIQDMGYYPFSQKLFTWFTHYVRGGDFVKNLIAEAQNINELAFALGALAHYYADVIGHPEGTNKVVPMLYPDIKKEYGEQVTFAEDKVSHMQTEFGFDVLFLAKGYYAPDDYRKAIGFRVAKAQLERAFLRTYGLRVQDLFCSYSVAVGAYRKTVSVVLPGITNSAREAKKGELKEIAADEDEKANKKPYRITNKEYRQRWGKDYERPSVFAKMLGFLIRYMPKIGPFRMFALQIPTPEAEQVFRKSFASTLSTYRQALQTIAEGGKLKLENADFDTGHATEEEQYEYTEKSYKKLLKRLKKSDFKHLSPELKQDLLSFFKHLQNNPEHDLDRKDERRLRKLKQAKVTSHQPQVQ